MNDNEEIEGEVDIPIQTGDEGEPTEALDDGDETVEETSDAERVVEEPDASHDGADDEEAQDEGGEAAGEDGPELVDEIDEEDAETDDEEDDETDDETDDDALDGLFLSPEDSESEVIVIEESEADVIEMDDEAEGAIAPAEDSAAVKELTALKDEMEELAEERDELKNRVLRTAADLENFRKRSTREKEELKKYGIDKVVLELLPVIDNLERALEHAEEAAEVSSIVDGVRMVHKQFLGALKKHGVEGFESKGEKFDPQKHEAIQQVETSEHETGTIIEQYQKGYFLHDRLIRPALVSVAKYVEGSDNAEAPEDVSDASEDVSDASEDVSDASEEESALSAEDADTAHEEELDTESSAEEMADDSDGSEESSEPTAG